MKNALRHNIEFDTVIVYGIGCIYKEEKAYLIELELDFKWQVATFCSFIEPQRIDELIVYALQKCKMWHF